MTSVLVVDDSAVVRQVLCEELSKAAGIQVVGSAVDPYVAREKIISLKPDVVTLDLEMPRMGGLTFLGKLMKYYPLPVIVVSSLTPRGSEAALRALELGAVDVIAKPGPGSSVGCIAQMLAEKIRAAAAAKDVALANRGLAAPAVDTGPQWQAPRRYSREVLAIGASTGGTEAIKSILVGLPTDTPGTLIVQHMPAGFTEAFANRLNQLCQMEVREARDNDAVQPGVALIAPGDRHMTLRRTGESYSVRIKDGPSVHHQRPSVDVLFHSVALQAGDRAVGAILTGMGTDGARGLLAMREAGARTLAQDAESCVVFGMAREAIQMGAAQEVTSLSRMTHDILDALADKTADAMCGIGRDETSR